MMPSNGPPTPKGVGGPSPPLVSSGSEEELDMQIPTGGSPTGEGGGRRLPLQGDEGGSSGIGRRTRSLPLLNEGGRIIP